MSQLRQSGNVARLISCACTFGREIRLGAVMYGGASLAVYENGIAQELFRAVQGEGVYGLLKRILDSEIYIHILSGTSAGDI